MPEKCSVRTSTYKEYQQEVAALHQQFSFSEPPQTTSEAPVVTEISCSNFPNPFNPETTISFSIPTDGHVELAVYNIRGQKVRTLVNSTMDTGSHSVVWDGMDESRKSVASGVYFYKITAENETLVRKMLMMK